MRIFYRYQFIPRIWSIQFISTVTSLFNPFNNKLLLPHLGLFINRVYSCIHARTYGPVNGDFFLHIFFYPYICLVSPPPELLVPSQVS